MAQMFGEHRFWVMLDFDCSSQSWNKRYESYLSEVLDMRNMRVDILSLSCLCWLFVFFSSPISWDFCLFFVFLSFFWYDFLSMQYAALFICWHMLQGPSGGESVPQLLLKVSKDICIQALLEHFAIECSNVQMVHCRETSGCFSNIKQITRQPLCWIFYCQFIFPTQYHIK